MMNTQTDTETMLHAISAPIDHDCAQRGLKTNWPGSVLHEDSFSLQLHEEFTTTQVLQYEVQLAAGLECIDEVDDEWILHNNK